MLRAAESRVMIRPWRTNGIRLAVLTAGLLVAFTATARPAPVPLPVTATSADGRVQVDAEAGLTRQAERLAKAAPSRLADASTDLQGLPRLDKVEIRLVRHAQDLAAVAPPGHSAPPWAVGVAWPDTGVLALALRARDGALIDAEGTLAHELAHLALGRALGDAQVPRWLTEGFAYQHSTDFSLQRALTLAGAALGGKLIPIGALEDSFPAREDAAALAYAESYDFVGYLVRRGRWPDDRDDGDRSAFRQLLAELAAGDSVSMACRSAYGRSLQDLEREWLESLRTRYLWYPLGASATLVWVLGACLLFAGWLRRKLQARRRLRQWAVEEARADQPPPPDPDESGPYLN